MWLLRTWNFKKFKNWSFNQFKFEWPHMASGCWIGQCCSCHSDQGAWAKSKYYYLDLKNRHSCIWYRSKGWAVELWTFMPINSTLMKWTNSFSIKSSKWTQRKIENLISPISVNDIGFISKIFTQKHKRVQTQVASIVNFV